VITRKNNSHLIKYDALSDKENHYHSNSLKSKVIKSYNPMRYSSNKENIKKQKVAFNDITSKKV